MAKPDNRSDNAEHLTQHIAHTERNIAQTEQHLNGHGDAMSPQSIRELERKNENRREAIDSFRQELAEESAERPKP